MRRLAPLVGTLAYLVGLATIGGSAAAGDVLVVCAGALAGVILMVLGAVVIIGILDGWNERPGRCQNAT